MHNDQQNYAGFFTRLFAYCIDMVVVSIALLAIKLPLAIIALFDQTGLLVKDIFFTYSFKDILFYVLQVAYFVIMTYTTGTTIGKALLNLKVVDDQNNKPQLLDIIFRESIGRFLSAASLYVGYLIIGFNPEHKGLHDILSDTKVVYNFKTTNTTTTNINIPCQVTTDEQQMVEVPSTDNV